MGIYLEVDGVWRNNRNRGTAGQRVMTHILVVGNNHVLYTGKYSKIMACNIKGLKSHNSYSKCNKHVQSYSGVDGGVSDEINMINKDILD